MGIASVTLLGVGWAGTTLGREDPDPAPEFDPASARYFDLPEGDAQIGISATGHGVVVRWRDRDGRTWTDPVVVHDAGRMELTTSRIRVGGPTLAMFATYTPPGTAYPEDDDEATAADWAALDDDDLTVFVVCRGGACTASEPYGATVDEPPQVTPDGEHAFLAEVGKVFVTWAGDAVEEQQPSGLPGGDAGGSRQPLLAPDGSLRAVHGVPAPGGCNYTLLTTEPDDAAFTVATTYQDPSDRRRRCTTDLETFSDDYVVVSRSKYRVWFLARQNGTWRQVDEDPSGQVRYPRPGEPRLAGAYERSGFWHWREAVTSSPDGRTLVVQLHFPGEERWGPPRVVARAPRGSECLSIDPMPTYPDGEEDPFYVNLRCRSRPGPGAEWVYSYPTAVTDDGRTWHRFVASGSALRVGRDLVFRGDPTYRWSPEAGLRVVDLSVPDGAVFTMLDDRTSALSSLVPEGAQCRLEVRLAGPDDTSWSEPVPSTASPIPRRFCTLADVSSEDRNLYHYFGDHRARPPVSFLVRLSWRTGEPVLEDGPGDCFTSDGGVRACPGR